MNDKFLNLSESMSKKLSDEKFIVVGTLKVYIFDFLSSFNKIKRNNEQLL